jgi:hypothetical protein
MFRLTIRDVVWWMVVIGFVVALFVRVRATQARFQKQLDDQIAMNVLASST